MLATILNLHYKANCYLVKKAIQVAICMKTVPIVDQLVIAKTSKGESQGCAFVTVCWDLHTTAVLKLGTKFLLTVTHVINSCKINSLGKLEGPASVAVEFLSRWPAVSATTSVSYEAYLSRKVSIARHS